MDLELNVNIEKKINNIIKWFMYIYVFGAPFSISLSQIGLVPAISLWLVKIIFIKKGKFYGSFIDIGILLYLVGELITSIFCHYSKMAFAGYQGEWQILTIWLMLEVFTKEDLKKLIDILFATSLITAIYGVYQYFSGWDLVRNRPLSPNAWFKGVHTFNITGGFGLHLTYGGFFMMIAILGFSLINIYYKKDMKRFWYYTLGTFIITFTVYGAYARSAWVGFLVGIFTFSFLKSKKLFVILLIIILLGGIIMYYTIPPFKYKVNTFKHLTELPRWQIWTVAIRIIKDHPIIGIGNGNFIRYYDKYKEKGWHEKMGHPHNDFLNIYITSGLLGFIGYMLIWFLLITYCFRFIKNTKDEFNKNIMISLISAIIAFLIAGLAQCYFSDSENSMLLWFFIGSILIIYYEENKKQNFPYLFFKNRNK